MLEVNREQVIALSALLTSCQQVHEVANTGSLNHHIMVNLEKSVFDFNPKTINDIFESTTHLRQGANFAKSLSTAENSGQAEIAQPMHYAMSLIQLAKELGNKPHIQADLKKRLEVVQRPEAFDDYITPEFFEKLANIYVETIGKLNTRIQVKGQPEQLKKDGNPERIRTLLLCGIRAAWLWLQMGGNRMQFFLARKKIAQIASTL